MTTMTTTETSAADIARAAAEVAVAALEQLAMTLDHAAESGERHGHIDSYIRSLRAPILTVKGIAALI